MRERERASDKADIVLASLERSPGSHPRPTPINVFMGGERWGKRAQWGPG